MPQKWLDPVQEGLPAPVVEAVSELRRIYQDGPFERLRQVEDAIVAARATTPGLVTVSAATCSRMLSPSRTELHKTALPRWPSVQAFLAVHGVDPTPFEPRWIAAREAWTSRRDGKTTADAPTEPELQAPDIRQEPPGGPDSPAGPGSPADTGSPADSQTPEAPAGAQTPTPEPAAGAPPSGAGAALRNGSGEPGAVLAAAEAGPVADAPAEPATAITPVAAGPMVSGPPLPGTAPAGPAADAATGRAAEPVPQPPPAMVWWRRPLVIGGLLLAALGLLLVGMLLGYLLARYQFMAQSPAAAQLPITCVRAVPEAGTVVNAEVEMVCRPVVR